MASRIEIPEFRLELRIGCSEDERSRYQPVEITIRVEKRDGFKATLTDDLNDTIDVNAICSVVRNTASEKPFATVEGISGSLIRALKQHFDVPGVRWELSISKIAVPIPGLQRGYRYVESE